MSAINHLRRGFTLMEMIVVIAIIMLLLALLFPFLRSSEEKAERAKCLSNVRQIATAAASEYGELGEVLPYRGVEGDAWNYWGRAAGQLLPYLRNVVGVFDCPANPGFRQDAYTAIPGYSGKYTDYEINGYLCTFGSGDESLRRQNTINDYSQTAHSYDFPYDPQSWGGYDPNRDRAHPGGVNCGYLDGHAAWLADSEMGVPETTNTISFFKRGHDLWRI